MLKLFSFKHRDAHFQIKTFFFFFNRKIFFCHNTKLYNTKQHREGGEEGIKHRKTEG